jgi:hypothetical protein
MARPSDGRGRTARVVLPSQQEMAIRTNRESRSEPSIPKRIASGRGGYAMTAEDAVAAASLMDRSNVVSPLAGLPTAASVGQFTEASSFLDDLSDEYYEYDQSGYGYTNRSPQAFDAKTTADKARRMGLGNTERDPAAITILPTSSTNPDRPRTVAAGYDGDREVLTVVFRDGTFYNYYTVSETEWAAFKAEYSKGRYILSKSKGGGGLDDKPRGTARMANTSLAGREGLYRIARTGQWINDGQVSGQFDRSLPPRLNPTRSRRRSK